MAVQGPLAVMTKQEQLKDGDCKKFELFSVFFFDAAKIDDCDIMDRNLMH